MSAARLLRLSRPLCLLYLLPFVYCNYFNVLFVLRDQGGWRPRSAESFAKLQPIFKLCKSLTEI